jgi:hypothetical protein
MVETGQTRVLFFKVNDSSAAKFESTSTHMTADNGLLASIEPKLKAKLLSIVDNTIAGAEI